MAGFTDEDHLINQISTLGKFWRADWNKLFNPTAAAVAGEWHTMFRGGGNPAADAIFNVGTSLVCQHVYDVTANAGCIPHGGNVGASATDYKVLLNASAFSASATTMPGVMMLVDLLAFYRITPATTTTAQTTINSNTFTASSSSGLLLTYTNDFPTYTKVRFTTSNTLPTGLSLATDYWLVRVSATTARVATSLPNAVAGTVIAFTDAGTGTHTLTTRLPRYADGAGVQCIFFNNNATAMGAGTPNLTLPSYTNAAGTASRATPSSPSAPVGKTAATNSHILYSGATAAGKYGPFLPLQAGDTGIASIQQIRNDATYTSNEYTVALCKPLITLPLTTIGVAGEREFKSQLPSLPRIYDGAALYWLYYSGAATPANSAFYGHLDCGWST
jgi:hypothetical protein